MTEPVLTPAATGAQSAAQTAAPGHAQSAAQSANSNAALPNRNPAGTINTLTVRNLEKRYGKRTVVKDVSLDVKRWRSGRIAGP